MLGKMNKRRTRGSLHKVKKLPSRTWRIPVKGVRAQHCAKSSTWVVLVEDFTDELKKLISRNLAAICHGFKSVQRDSSLYSYNNTVKEFVKRYKPKSPDIKKGMIGELLAHVLIKELIANLKPATPFFNMEENSIKKGFDLVLVDGEKKTLWITEVKAGEANGKEANTANTALLHTAKRDLKKRLGTGSTTLWHNAVFAASATMKEGTTKKKTLDLLDNILKSAMGKKTIASDRSVVLVSVLYNNIKDRVTLDALTNFANQLTVDCIFNNAIVLSIQKNTYKKVERFMASEARK